MATQAPPSGRSAHLHHTTTADFFRRGTDDLGRSEFLTTAVIALLLPRLARLPLASAAAGTSAVFTAAAAVAAFMAAVSAAAVFICATGATVPMFGF